MDVATRVENAKIFDIYSASFEMLFGDEIGHGTYRDVYVYQPNPRYVVKVERTSEALCNMREFLFWTAVDDKEHIKKWLCPIREMSSNGRVLVMKKMTPITEKNKHKIPKLTWERPIREDDFIVCIGVKQSNTVYHVAESIPKPHKFNPRFIKYNLKVYVSDLPTALKRDKTQGLLPMKWYKREKKK